MRSSREKLKFSIDGIVKFSKITKKRTPPPVSIENPHSMIRFLDPRMQSHAAIYMLAITHLPL